MDEANIEMQPDYTSRWHPRVVSYTEWGTTGQMREAGLPAIFLVPSLPMGSSTNIGGAAYTSVQSGAWRASSPSTIHAFVCICVFLPPVTFTPAWPPTLAKLVAVALLLFFSFVKRPSPLSLLLLPAFSRYPTIVSLSELCFSTCLSRELCRASSVSDPFRPDSDRHPAMPCLGCG
jgi:hypothetical protein